MRKDAQSAAFFARLFYVMMHSLVFVVLFSYPNDFKSSLSSITGSFGVFLVLKVLGSVLYFTCGISPGYLSQSSFGSLGQLQEEDWDPPEHNYCEACLITQPYRTKHCTKCGECVAKYDHHCFWIGSCVGEKNHFRFVVFLCVDSCCFLWGGYVCLSGLQGDPEAYGAFVVSTLICWGFGVLTVGLGFYHIFLISTGTTTWEAMSRARVTYLKPYPYYFNPFDEGFFENWRRAIFDKELRDWTLPRPRAVYPFNWCENEYWSCC